MNTTLTVKSDDENQLSSLKDRLRSRRKELGLTMQQVAEQAGLSIGFISQIERGITTPSLSSLVSVSRVLGFHVSEFLAQPRANTADTRHDHRPVYAISESSVSYERISTQFPSSILRSVIIHKPPGHRSESISHDGEEIFFILAGSLTVEIDGVVSILETGDSIHFSSTNVHSTWNHTDTSVSILWTGTMDVFGEDDHGKHLPRHKNKNHSKWIK